MLISCIQELDDQPATYLKVLGKEAALVARGQAITKLENGHLLIYGSGSRYMFDDADESYFPFIIEIDEFGNEAQYKTYPIFEGEFQRFLTSYGLSSNFFDVEMSLAIGIFDYTNFMWGNQDLEPIIPSI